MQRFRGSRPEKDAAAETGARVQSRKGVSAPHGG